MKLKKSNSFVLLMSLGLMGLGATVLVGWGRSRGWNLATFPDIPIVLSPPTALVPQGSPAPDFAAVQQVPTGRFNYGGSSAWAPIRLNLDPAIQAARPELQLHYVKPVATVSDSQAGIQMVLDGSLSFAQSSQPLQEQDYRQAQQQGMQLQQIPVAIDGLAVAVHPSLAIPGLTLEQLTSIYSGKIVNWQEVGGPDLAITPYRNPDNDELFVKELMGGQDFVAATKELPTTTAALRELAKDPGGIYYASAPLIVSQCTVKPLPIGRRPGQWIPPYQEPLVPPSLCPQRRNQLNAIAFQTGEYPITRSLFVIVKQDQGREQQAGEAYANLLLTDQGQELLKRAGFIKIR